MNEASAVEVAFERAINWAWNIRNPDYGWGRAKGDSSKFSDSAELLLGLIKAGVDPKEERMIESIAFVKNKYLSADKRHQSYSDWTAKPNAFKYHMFVALLGLELNWPHDDQAFNYVRKAIDDYRMGDGWCSDKEINETNVHDTTYALEVLTRLQENAGLVEKGRSWLRDVQNQDGGWSFLACEKSNPVCTSLAVSTLMESHKESVAKGVEWLKRRQLEEGRWRITYELGIGHADAYRYNSTGFALKALMLAGENPFSEAIQKAVSYLLSVQSKEGGWYLVGEENIMPPCEKLQALVYITAQVVDGLVEFLHSLPTKALYAAGTVAEAGV